jgi:hypothetical protein
MQKALVQIFFSEKTDRMKTCSTDEHRQPSCIDKIYVYMQPTGFARHVYEVRTHEWISNLWQDSDLTFQLAMDRGPTINSHAPLFLPVLY